jgi:ClpP class serine protease
MQELLYAGEPTFFRSYLQAKINAPEAERARAHELHPLIFEPGSFEAVNEIYSRDGSDAVIQIVGPLSMSGPDAWDRYMGYGGVAYPTLIEAIKRAQVDAGVSRIVFPTNSPGGEISGTDLTWQAHIDARKTKKTLCLISGMAASAAYYVVCPARIEARAPTDEAGSIGVIIAYWDFTKAYNEMGITRVEIRSKNAPKKALDGSTKAGRDVLQDRVDAFERVFYARISEARGVTPDFIKANFGQGALLIARDPDSTKPDAIRSRLIDALASEPSAFPISTSPEDEGDDDSGARAATRAPSVAESTPKTKPNLSPAIAGTSQSQEVHTMNLSEFLAQGPAAVAEIDQVKKTAREEGKAEQLKIGARVGEIISKDAYAKSGVIRTKAKETLEGKMSLESFEAVIGAADMQAEGRASEAAAGETDALGETHADGPKGDAGEAKTLGHLIAAQSGRLKEGK